MKEKNISIVQGVCATVVFLSYFLPWVDTPLGDISFAKGVYEITRASSEVPLIFMLGYVVIFLAGVNVLCQWLLKAPIGAFYFNLLPLGICLSVIAGLDAFSLWNLSLEYAGMGFWGTFLASLVSGVDAWTTMGKHYYTRYKTYMIVASVLTALSFVVMMSTSMVPGDLFSSGSGEKWAAWSRLISNLWFITHLPFVLYGWIVFGLTRGQQLWWLEHDSKQKSLQAGLNSAHAENQGADSVQESVVQPALQEERPKVETVQPTEERPLQPQTVAVPPKPSRKLSKRSILIMVGSVVGVLVLALAFAGLFGGDEVSVSDPRFVRCTANAVNLRERPDASSARLYAEASESGRREFLMEDAGFFGFPRQLNDGEIVQVVSEAGDWYELLVDGVHVYAMKQFLAPIYPADIELGLEGNEGMRDLLVYYESGKYKKQWIYNDYNEMDELQTFYCGESHGKGILFTKRAYLWWNVESVKDDPASPSGKMYENCPLLQRNEYVYILDIRNAPEVFLDKIFAKTEACEVTLYYFVESDSFVWTYNY